MKILDFVKDILFLISMIICAIFSHFYILDNWNNYDFPGKLFLIICLTIINLCVAGYLITMLFDISYNLKIKK